MASDSVLPDLSLPLLAPLSVELVNASIGEVLTTTWAFGDGTDYSSEVSHSDDHTGNPAFAADGYHLTAGSAAIDRGVDAGVTSDVDGDARPMGGGYDIGADEFGSAAPTVRTIHYTYDALNRLTRADYLPGGSFIYQYNAVGNRIEMTGPSGEMTTYAYDAANRLTSAGDVTYTWDARGNLLNDGTFTYAYDGAGRMVRAESGTAVLEYTYNAQGLRVAQSVDSDVTTFAWDWASGVPEMLSDGSTLYLLGHDTLGRFVDGERAYYLPDALGSVRQEADGTGAVVSSREWTPYGVEVGGSTDTGLGYAGEWQDPNVGMVYLRARWYDGQVGRFTRRDPWRGDHQHPLTLHPYLYVLANPVRYSDPSGYITEEEAKRALETIELLKSDYGVIIRVDFGWKPIPVMHPAPGERIACSVWEKGMWKPEELDRVTEAVSDLAFMMKGADKFRQNLGRVIMQRRHMKHGGLGEAHSVILTAGYFTKWTVVHELSHAWDGANSWRLSRGLQEHVGGRWLLFPRTLPGGIRYRYDPGMWPPPAGINMSFNAKEDFAESVTAFVYPGKAKEFAEDRLVPYYKYGYANYYQTPRAWYIAKLLGRTRECKLWTEMW